MLTLTIAGLITADASDSINATAQRNITLNAGGAITGTAGQHIRLTAPAIFLN